MRTETTRALRALAGRQAGDGCVVVSFADGGHLPILLNWLLGLERIDVHNVVLCALDAETYTYLNDRGFPAASIPRGSGIEGTRTARLHVARALLADGLDLIQSDADAVWLQDPRPAWFSSTSDVVISQGTYWPDEAYDTWGFVICTGLHRMRANDRVRTLVDRWIDDITHTGSDQRSLNRLLVDAGVVWSGTGARSGTRRFRDDAFTTFDGVLHGRTTGADLDLDLDLLPHNRFQRVPTADESPVVVHWLPDIAGDDRSQRMLPGGTWWLRDDWRTLDFDIESVSLLDVRTP